VDGSPIFIVGCPRSGTALLRNLLRSHPRLTFPDESHFIPRFYKAYGNPANSDEARLLAEKILSLKWVINWELELDPDDFIACRSYRDLVSHIFEVWAEKQKKPRWGDKTPRYVSEIPTLLEIFPDGQIIHIYRDGRDVAMSWIRAGFGPMNTYVAATSWRNLVKKGRSDGGTLRSQNYMEIRYESLLSDPRNTMKNICTFLGETFVEDLLTPSASSRQLSKKWFGKRPSLSFSQSKLNASNFGKWEVEMNETDRLLFESIAGNLLQELGYKTELRRRKITVAEKWLWKIHDLCKLFLRRLNRRDTVKWLYTFAILHFTSFIHAIGLPRNSKIPSDE